LQVLLAWVYAHGTGGDGGVALLPLSYFMGLVGTELLALKPPRPSSPSSPAPPLVVRAPVSCLARL
jgi:hypothetical protein